MNKKWLLVGVLCGMALLLALTGCGAKGAVDEEAASKLITDPVELVVYHPFRADWPEENFQATFAEPLKEKYPYITLQYIAGGSGVSLESLLTGGQRIDLIYTSIGASFTNLIDFGMQQDITDLIRTYDFDLNTLDPTILDMAYKLGEGSLYGLPVFTPPSAIYYNRDIFDRFGVNYPNHERVTWDELYDMHRRLTRVDEGKKYYGVGMSYGHTMRTNQYSLPLVDAASVKATIDKDARWNTFISNLVRFYQFNEFEGLRTNQLSEPHERNRFFQDRTVAMFLALTALHQESEVNDINWDLAPYPVFPDNPVGPQPYATYFYVTSATQHRDQAFNVAAYFASEEFQAKPVREGQFLTALASPQLRASFGQDNPFYQGKNIKALQPEKYANAAPVHKYDSIPSGEINTMLRRMVQDRVWDLNTALREAGEIADQKIKAREEQ